MSARINALSKRFYGDENELRSKMNMLCKYMNDLDDVFVQHRNHLPENLNVAHRNLMQMALANIASTCDSEKC